MNLRELFRNLSPEERTAVKAAIRQKTNTNLDIGAPDFGFDGIPQYSFCTDCETWHISWTGTFFDVSDGELITGTWTCDTDGNWDYDICGNLRDYEKIYENIIKNSQESQKEYFKWVAKTGNDPLKEIHLSTEITKLTKNKQKDKIKHQAQHILNHILP